jgi:hypothetical protein
VRLPCSSPWRAPSLAVASSSTRRGELVASTVPPGRVLSSPWQAVLLAVASRDSPDLQQKKFLDPKTSNPTTQRLRMTLVIIWNLKTVIKQVFTSMIAQDIKRGNFLYVKTLEICLSSLQA